MTKGIYLHLPIDIDTSKSYEIPTIENQKDVLIEAILSAPQEPEEAANQQPQQSNVNSFSFGNFANNNNRKATQEMKAEEKIMKAQHFNWIDIMSFSHNVASAAGSKSLRSKRIKMVNGDEEAHVGEFTCTKFVSHATPSLNYLCLRREIIPHAIIRILDKIQKDEDAFKINIIEYELQYVRVSHVSVSGGTGGKPVETLSLSPRVIKTKYIDLNFHTREFDTYQVYHWDTITNTGSKTIFSQGSATKSLLEYAKKRLMIDLDSQDPSMIALIKELGLVTDYELPSEKLESHTIKISVSKEPITFKRITVKSLTIKSVIAAIAEKLAIPAQSITNLFSIDNNNTEIETDEDLQGTTSILFKQAGGKFYGY
ncbi:hypothetical protein PPL_11717 [Heterostelium album PN500]|uniref:Uncharacterized protein n=1 Tax=Heterostelium pallidum (strain ATCC 26659 / Pp 5 / PN500) TaxID=670386 RepID=D3BU98_HETP5|nr:hypothetical protein PPL_11717 [Heterostelium album PN500]EFA75032.1 hypothetical protein PPL_11717 [Heterostelium album PN500]|eukprot:XP_020427166.1 hypothetical protein PPL_11717 [Heterostelium album PN500]